MMQSKWALVSLALLILWFPCGVLDPSGSYNPSSDFTQDSRVVPNVWLWGCASVFISCWVEDEDRGEYSSIAGGSANISSYFGNQYRCFWENWEWKYLNTKINHSCAYPKHTPSYHKDTCSTMFITVLFVISRTGNNLNAPQLKSGYGKCVTVTQLSISQLLQIMTSWNLQANVWK